MHTDYRTPSIRKFRDDQFSVGSPDEILRQAERAEALIGEINPKETYRSAELLRRVAGKKKRRDASGEEAALGKHALHDLQLFVEDASEAAGMTAESAGEQIVTMQELAKQLNVSTKTITRWRKQGLVGRRFLHRGRVRIGFLKSSVLQFVRANRERVRRGAEFSQLSDEERCQIIVEARRMAESGAWPAEITKRLADSSGRNVETIRYTLRHFDKENPDEAIFPDHHGPPRPETAQKIYQQYRRGESIDALSKKFCRTKASIQRIILKMRAHRIMELPLDYVPSPEFVEEIPVKVERKLLGPMPCEDQPVKKVRLPKGLPPYLASLYEVPLLTREQEMHLFRRMNYLKYKACCLRDKLNLERPRNRLMDRIERLANDAVSVKNQILRANLRLVVSIAKRHVGPTVSFFELVSDGNISLIRAVEKFDYTRGNKFSTYASWAIMKNYARSIPGELRHIDRFRTGQSDVFISRKTCAATSRNRKPRSRSARRRSSGSCGDWDGGSRRSSYPASA